METIKIFVSYAREDKRWILPDENSSLIPWLMESLRREKVVFWYDTDLVASEVYRQRIEDEIDAASIAVLLISQAFLNSEFIETVELPKIKSRADRGKLHVVPVLVGACAWQENDFLSTRQLLPGTPKPLIKYLNDESDWDGVRYEILVGLKKLIQKVRNSRTTATPAGRVGEESVADDEHANPPDFPQPTTAPNPESSGNKRVARPARPSASEPASSSVGKMLWMGLAAVVMVGGVLWFQWERTLRVMLVSRPRHTSVVASLTSW